MKVVKESGGGTSPQHEVYLASVRVRLRGRGRGRGRVGVRVVSSPSSA